jgi:hypothetical protein
LTDGQLDRVTAGGTAIVVTASDAAAAGVVALTETAGNSLVIPEESPYPGQPNLHPTGGVAEGTALAVGNNIFGQPNQPPASANTSVTTVGAATGNMVINSTFNHTVQGAGGVVFQVGWTFVYGAFLGL